MSQDAIDNIDEAMESGDLEAVAALFNQLDSDDESEPEENKEAETEETEAVSEEIADEKPESEEGEPASAEPVIKAADGINEIPIKVLTDARRENQANQEKIRDLQSKLADQDALLDKLKRSGIDPESVQDPSVLTDEQLKGLEEYEDLGGVIKALYMQNQQIKEQIASATPSDDTPADNPVNTIVDSDPHLSAWQKEAGDKWESALSIDEVLQRDPNFQNAPLDERFAEVVRRTQAMYGEVTPAEQQKEKAEEAKPDPEKVIAEKLAKAEAPIPTSLTDSGIPPTQEKTLAERTAELEGDELIAALEKMTPAQQEQLLGADVIGG